MEPKRFSSKNFSLFIVKFKKLGFSGKSRGVGHTPLPRAADAHVLVLLRLNV